MSQLWIQILSLFIWMKGLGKVKCIAIIWILFNKGKLGKEYVKSVYCHPSYLTSMQSTSCEILGWMKHKLESRFQGESSITPDMQMTPPLWQNAKKN